MRSKLYQDLIGDEPLAIRFRGVGILITNHMIDKQALAQDLYSLAPVGALPKGGVTRLAFSPEEAELHQRVSHWLTDLGAKVKKDAIGNLIARWPGQDNSLPAGGLRFSFRLGTPRWQL